MDREELWKKIAQVKSVDFLTSDGFYKDAIENIEDALKKKPFRIVVVGEFSTGKSTFINALLGRDLLLHATEEVTAAITNIHNVECSDSRWHTCDVFFSDGKVEHLKDDSLLLNYTTTKSKEINVVNAIKSVDYYTDFMDATMDTILVDTPGLNGMADGHRELTLQEVKRADFCIYLVGIRGLAETDKIMLKEMSYYQKNFVFVINFVDQLKISEGETVEEKIEEIKEFLKEDIFKESNINYEIFGVSSLKALAGKDKSISKLYQGDTENISDEARKMLYEESNMKLVEEYIVQHINNETIDNLTVDRVRHMLINMLDSAIDDLKERKERIGYLRSIDSDDKKIQKMEERLAFFLESSKKNKDRVINYAESQCIAIKKEFKIYLQNSLKEIREKYTQKLNSFEKYEDLENYIKTNRLGSEIKVDVDKIYDYVEENMLYCLNDILNNILVRIQEYLKSSELNSDNQVINFEVKKGIRRTDTEVLEAETVLSEIERKESEARENIKALGLLRKNEEKRISEAEKEFVNNKNNLEEAINKKEQRIADLGAQPEVEQKTIYTKETYYEDVYRGGWGILDTLFGPKRVKRIKDVPHTIIDDSKREAWLKERVKILNSLNPEIEQYQSELDVWKNKINKAKKSVKKAEFDEQQAREDLRSYQQEYEYIKETIDNLKSKVNKELLQSLRNSLMSQLNEYCADDGNIAAVIENYVDETIEVNKKIICEKTAEFYELRLESLTGIYENKIAGKVEANNQKYEEYEAELMQTRQIREEL